MARHIGLLRSGSDVTGKAGARPAAPDQHPANWSITRPPKPETPLQKAQAEIARLQDELDAANVKIRRRERAEG